MEYIRASVVETKSYPHKKDLYEFTAYHLSFRGEMTGLFIEVVIYRK